MSTTDADPFGLVSCDARPHPVTDAPSVADLPASTRKAIRSMQEYLRAKARVPVFALVGGDWEERSQAARALCTVEHGLYMHIGSHVREQLLADDNLRTEWVTVSYLASRVIDLARAHSAPVLVIDGWEAMLGLLRKADASGPTELLRSLIYRALPAPIVLVMEIGPGGYSSAAEVRLVMESQGRSRVVELGACSAGEAAET